MKAATKRKMSSRTLTLISKIEELQQFGCEDSDLNQILPGGLEGWIQ